MEKSCYIFDVDGTLYSQKKMHVHMAWKMLCFLLTHVSQWKDLYAIYLFRKLREEERYKLQSVNELSEIVGMKLQMDAKGVEDIIKHWMYQVPLEVLLKCAYSDVICAIRTLHNHGTKIYIYSDYPAAEKIAVLDIPVDGIFTAEDEAIHELKPSQKAMDWIFSRIGEDKATMIFIGDRDEKDGASAKLINIDYCNIKVWRTQMRKRMQYE